MHQLCLEQDSLIEPIPLQACIEFSVVILLDGAIPVYPSY